VTLPVDIPAVVVVVSVVISVAVIPGARAQEMHIGGGELEVWVPCFNKKEGRKEEERRRNMIYAGLLELKQICKTCVSAVN
jgi:hypothetical protein